MEDVVSSLIGGLPRGLASIYPVVLTLVTTLVIGNLLRIRSRNRRQNLPPAVPGIPLIGNLLQMKEKKPHQTFAKWADIYGPIYTIKAGASTVVVLNSSKVAKEAMVTRYSSISSRKLSKALMLLTSNKAMVTTSDYGEFYKMTKRYLMNSLLGSKVQKNFRGHRDTMISNILNILRRKIEVDPVNAINFREPFESELFSLTLKEALGEDVESIYVEELGKDISKEEIFHAIVTEPMAGAIEVDWRDFFPYLGWIPNKSFEMKIEGIVARMKAVTRALIMKQKKRIALGEERNAYVDALLKEKTLTEDQLTSLIWETAIAASDTTLVATEWAMFELAKNPKCQDRLYGEIRQVCGSEWVTEEHLSQLPYLDAVFHETLRRYSPAPILPLRYVHENTQLGGYDIPAGSEIAINIYGCNMNKNDWQNPEEWNPERFLDSKYRSTDMFKTMAFGGGKRVCAGALQAVLISCTAIGRFVQEFEWRLKEGEDENVGTVQFTTQKFHPLHACLTPRDTSMPSTS